MGIKGLTDLLAKHAPEAIRKHSMKELAGRSVAIDASVSIYQFLSAIRGPDRIQLSNGPEGEVTSHLAGTFYRTLTHLENRLRPTWVFDGRPPDMKAERLAERASRRETAKRKEDALDSMAVPASSPSSSSPSGKAILEGSKDQALSDSHQSISQVRVSASQNVDVQRLLRLMGVPVVLAPGEAEAQCAELARAGLVDAAGSEDLDTLAFGSPVLLRHLSLADKKKAIVEFRLDRALESLDMDMDQFIELCILLGCDYLAPIHGIGPVKALKLLRAHRSLGALIPHLQDLHAKKLVDPKTKSGGIIVPDSWDWRGVKEEFRSPLVAKAQDVGKLTRSAPDTEGLVSFLVKEKGFNEKRIRTHAEKLQMYYIRDNM